MSAFASCGRLHSLMKSTALQIPSYDELLTENALLRASNQELQARVSQLEESLSQVLSQLDWFKRQVFGKTSEKFYPSDVSTLPLFAPGTIEPAQGEESKKMSYRKQSADLVVKPNRSATMATAVLGLMTM